MSRLLLGSGSSPDPPLDNREEKRLFRAARLVTGVFALPPRLQVPVKYDEEWDTNQGRKGIYGAYVITLRFWARSRPPTVGATRYPPCRWHRPNRYPNP